MVELHIHYQNMELTVAAKVRISEYQNLAVDDYNWTSTVLSGEEKSLPSAISRALGRRRLSDSIHFRNFPILSRTLE